MWRFLSDVTTSNALPLTPVAHALRGTDRRIATLVTVTSVALVTTAGGCASDPAGAGRVASSSPAPAHEAYETASSSSPRGAMAILPPNASDDASPGETAAPLRPPATIYRDEITRATNGGRPAYLLRQLQPVAHRPRGQFLGWELQSVWPDGPELAAMCGLRAGEVIVAVNGLSMEFPDDRAKLLAKLETATELRVRRLRQGRLEEKAWNIVDATP